MVGASGGVYALLAAHLANVLLNYNNMEFGLVRLLGVFLIGKEKKVILKKSGDETKERCSSEFSMFGSVLNLKGNFFAEVVVLLVAPYNSHIIAMIINDH